MLFSVAIILISGLFLGWLCQKIKLPSLIGMLLTGIIFGPYCLNFIDSSILNVSADIRKIALIIILTRAGLSLNVKDLKKIGRPALMMCFVPATFELLGMLILGPWILGISYLEAAVLGSVLAAVSPAVVVPRMVKLMEENYGMEKGIPQLILAGASVDDVFVIVLFSTFTGIASGGEVSVLSFVNIPFSIVTGIAVGILAGILIALLFKKLHFRDTAKVLVILSVSCLLVVAENSNPLPLNISALIAIMFIGVGIQKINADLSKRLSSKYNKLWTGAEVFLFVLVGAEVNIGYLGTVGWHALLLIAAALVFRMAGVFACLIKTNLNFKERLFTMMAYTPKATVQAAIGGIPLAMGLGCGELVLTVAVLSIVLTAPLGAFAIDVSYKKFLSKTSSDISA